MLIGSQLGRSTTVSCIGSGSAELSAERVDFLSPKLTELAGVFAEQMHSRSLSKVGGTVRSIRRLYISPQPYVLAGRHGRGCKLMCFSCNCPSELQHFPFSVTRSEG